MRFVVLLSCIAVGLSFVLVRCAHATDCPAGAPSCKVITLTPEEENALVGVRMILETAAAARNLDLGLATVYFRNKIKEAPQGDVKPSTTPQVDTPVPRMPGNSVAPADGAAPVPKPDPRK